MCVLEVQNLKGRSGNFVAFIIIRLKDEHIQNEKTNLLSGP
jgi:hypothetical protein